MALTATFEPDRSRVKLEFTGGTGAVTADFTKRRFTDPDSARVPVRGASEVPVSGGATPVVYDYEFLFSDPPSGSMYYRVETNNNVGNAVDTVEVTIEDEAWLKFPGFPFLNRAIPIIGRGRISRAGRGQVLQVLSNRYPVAVQEFMTSRTFDFTMRTTTWADFIELDTRLVLGAIVYLHGDEARLGLPSMYGVVKGVESEPAGPAHSQTRYTTLTLEEVAQPSHLYTGSPGTYQTVLNNYTTYQELLDGQPTYLDLLALEGSAADVVVS